MSNNDNSKDDSKDTYQVRLFFEQQEARNEMPYDGILGSLPASQESFSNIAHR